MGSQRTFIVWQFSNVVVESIGGIFLCESLWVIPISYAHLPELVDRLGGTEDDLLITHLLNEYGGTGEAPFITLV